MPYKFTLSHITAGTLVIDDPEGWEDMDITIRRDRQAHGLFKEATQAFGFYCDGGGLEFIETLHAANGIDQVINMLIQDDCNDDGDFVTLYDAQAKMATLRKEDQFLFLNFTQQGIAEKVRARFNLPVDLARLTTLDGTVLTAFTFGPYNLRLDSLELDFESQLLDTDADTFIFSMTSDETIKRFWIQQPNPVVKNELKETTNNNNFSVKTLTSVGISGIPAAAFHDSSGQSPILLPGSYDLVWNINGDFIDNMPTSAGRNVGTEAGVPDINLFVFYGQNLTDAQTNGKFELLGSITGYVQGSGTATTTSAINFGGSATIALIPGDKLWMIWQFSYDVTTGTAGVGQTINITVDYTGGGDQFDLSFSINSLIDNTFARAYAIHEAFARISQVITDQTDGFLSDYFGRKDSQPVTYADNGCGSFLAVMNGYAVRGESETDFPYAVSMQDLFTGISAIHSLGWGIEDGGSDQVIRVERVEFFYDTTIVLTITEIDHLIITEDEQSYFTDIKIGYETWQPEDINALDEFNTEFAFTTQFQVLDNTLEGVSDFIAAGYTIEITRRKQFEDTTDWRFDTNSFAVSTKRTVDGGGTPTELDRNEQDENFTVVTGINNSPTTYNLRLSPKRNLYRHMAVINAGLDRYPARQIKFLDGEGNIDMASNIVPTGCPGDLDPATLSTEKANFEHDTTLIVDVDPIWLPLVYEFEAPLSSSDFQLIRANPRQSLKISEGSTSFVRVFLLEVTYEPTQRKAAFMCIKAFDQSGL